MKKIKIESWKVKDKDGNESEENTVTLLSALLTHKDPATMPKGFKQALIFYRILKAFENKEALS